VAVEAKPLLAAEAKERQREHGGTAPGRKNTGVKNDTSEGKVRNQVAKQFDVSQGYVHAARAAPLRNNDSFAFFLPSALSMTFHISQSNSL
jgi:hypothetical protein